MKKKLVLFLVLAVVATGSVFAQEKYDGSFKHTITAGLMQAGYEISVFPMISAGVETGFNLLGGTFADVFGRWYPAQRIFFTSIGLGYQHGNGLGGAMSDDDYYARGFLILPQVGWKIDVGDVGRFVFEARIGLGMTIGSAGFIANAVSFPIMIGWTL